MQNLAKYGTRDRQWWQQPAWGLASAILLLGLPKPMQAAEFEAVPVEQENFIAIAAPFGKDEHKLLILEQIPGKKQCWATKGKWPTQVVPLLVHFDFSGQCRRYTDSNSYSVRVGNKDLDLVDQLVIWRRDHELWLEADPVIGQKGKPIRIGRTFGDTQGFAKIVLSPGWRFARRAYQGKPLGHIYLMHDGTLQELQDFQPIDPTSQPAAKSS